MATVQSIEVYRGEQVLLNFTMNPTENISGWSIHFTVAKKANSTAKLIGPLSATILPSGVFSVALTEENLDLAPGKYVYDAWRTNEGYEQVLAAGDFTILGNARVPPVDVV